MQISLSMWSTHRMYFQQGFGVVDFLDFSKEMNVRHVELLSIFWRNPKEELPLVQDRLSRGMLCASYALSNDFASPDRDEYDRSREEVLKGIDMAKSLGTAVIRIFSGNSRDGVTFSRQFEQIVSGMREAAQAAEKTGVTLCLENHGYLAGRSEHIQAILDTVASPNLAATFDIGNFLLVDEDPLEAQRKLLPYIRHVHVKDIEPCHEDPCWHSATGKRLRGARLGRGIVPFREALRVFRSLPYNGYVTLEFEGPGDERTGVAESLAALREAVGE